MKCPYCGREMEEGYLQSMKEVIYAKKPHKILSIPRKDDIRLTTNAIAPATCDAWRCASCRKVMIHY